MITFEQPLLLLLFLPIAVLVYLTWRRAALPFSLTRRRLILACRLVLFALIITALAGATWSQPVSRQAVVFVGDLSDSTAPQRTVIEQWITNALRYKQPNDQVGIVAVGRNALVEQSLSTHIDFARFESAPDTNFTDLSAGLRLAAAMLPSNSQRRIVLLSDGQQNLGDAQQEAQLLQQEGIRLDVVPLPTTTSAEALIAGLDAPTELQVNERFVVHIRLSSTVAQSAILRIYLDQSLLVQQPIHLSGGEQSTSFSLLAPPAGYHNLRVTIDAAQDTLLQNNQATAFLHVQGPPHVLLLEGKPGAGQNIAAALRATKIDVTVGTPNDVPSTLEGLAPYSAVVLADVPAVALGTTHMVMLQSYVRDLGRGLVVSGGENSYGIGGYANTPLEETLPVSMDIPQHKETPSVAVVLIIESLEANYPINISKEAAKGVVNLLTPRDQVGISDAYGSLVVPMQYVTNKAAINKAIDAMDPGDPSSYMPDLQNAEQVLLHSNAKIKHVILLGDGDTFDGSPVQLQAAKMAKEQITVSTVATNSQSFAELATMQQLAAAGKGRFYRADDPATIPQVLLKETQQAARRSVINEPFVPAIVGSHPVLTGLNALPSLGGYVATTPKPTAQMVLISHRDDPVLATWQYGLGRVAAWTSDALGLWTANWLRWDEAARWWANLVTWVLPSPESALHVNGTIVGDTGQLTVDLPSDVTSSSAQGQQQMQAHIIAPDLSQGTMTLQPSAPGRWQGQFPADQVGTYLLQVTWRASNNGTQGGVNALTTTTGLVVPYSPEYRDLGTNTPFLKRLAQAANGTVLTSYAAAFATNLPPVTTPTPIFFLLLALAALLLPIDIAARRLSSLEFLTNGYQGLVAKLRPRTSQPAIQIAGVSKKAASTAVSAPLSTLRLKREQERQQRPRPTVPQPPPKAREPVTTQARAPTKPEAAAPPPAAKAQPQELSTAARLVERKRQRSQAGTGAAKDEAQKR